MAQLSDKGGLFELGDSTKDLATNSAVGLGSVK